MKYYKAVKEIYDYSSKNTTVMNELLTPRERKTKFYSLTDACFEEVEISKKNTYINFGVRFEKGTNHNGRRD